VKNFEGTNEYDDELETYQNFNFERIYIDDSSEEEVGLYVLEAIPNVRILIQAYQRVQGDNDQSTPCVLTDEEIVEWVNKIQLGLDLHHEEKRQYEDLLHKYIHLFAFSYKDLREVTMEQHKIKLLLNAKLVRTKQRRWNLRYIAMVKEKFDKLLEAGFFKPMETMNGFFLWYWR